MDRERLRSRFLFAADLSDCFLFAIGVFSVDFEVSSESSSEVKLFQHI